MEPGFNFELPATLRVRLADQWDIRTTGRGVVEIEGGDMEVDVLAYKGDKGDAGRDGMPPRYMGTVATEIGLPSPGSLTATDIGKWWGVAGTPHAWFYNGTAALAKRENYVQVGPVGPAITISKGTITEGEDWGFSLEQTDTTAFKLNIVAKPGPKGDDSVVPGPVATIGTASDFDGSTAPEVGDALVYIGGGDWAPRKLAMSPGVFKKDGSAADWLAVNTGNNWSGDYATITTLTIPAQPWAYEPDVHALVEFMVAGNNVRMDLEARLNSVSGPLLGRGTGSSVGIFENEWTPRTLVPGGNETSAPGASSTIVAAGAPATIHLVGRRVDSTSKLRFETRKERAMLRVRPMPVIA